MALIASSTSDPEYFALDAPTESEAERLTIVERS
jgi:hypothetical protein